jgi:7,8-dihydroneopterin aldolase/epimerase/oxygenase
VNTTWSIRIEKLPTQLRVGVDPGELAPQPVWVTLRLRGAAAACPSFPSECIDHAPLCRWITEQWPRAPHTPLLETRVNELVAAAFNLDDRIQEVQAGLAKGMGALGGTVGIERCVSRPEFEAQRRHLASQAVPLTKADRMCDEHQIA